MLMQQVNEMEANVSSCKAHQILESTQIVKIC